MVPIGATGPGCTTRTYTIAETKKSPATIKLRPKCPLLPPPISKFMLAKLLAELLIFLGQSSVSFMSL